MSETERLPYDSAPGLSRDSQQSRGHVWFAGIVKGTCCCCQRRGHVLHSRDSHKEFKCLNHLFLTSWGKQLPRTLRCASQLNKEFNSFIAFT